MLTPVDGSATRELGREGRGLVGHGGRKNEVLRAKGLFGLRDEPPGLIEIRAALSAEQVVVHPVQIPDRSIEMHPDGPLHLAFPARRYRLEGR